MTRLILMSCVFLIGGCTDMDPYRRTDVWYPSGSNAGNIAAMAAKPSDLILGRGSSTGDEYQATAAVNRIWHDRAKPLFLPSAGASSTGAAAGAGAAN